MKSPAPIRRIKTDLHVIEVIGPDGKTRRHAILPFERAAVVASDYNELNRGRRFFAKLRPVQWRVVIAAEVA